MEYNTLSNNCILYNHCTILYKRKYGIQYTYDTSMQYTVLYVVGTIYKWNILYKVYTSKAIIVYRCAMCIFHTFPYMYIV